MRESIEVDPAELRACGSRLAELADRLDAAGAAALDHLPEPGQPLAAFGWRCVELIDAIRTDAAELGTLAGALFGAAAGWEAAESRASEQLTALFRRLSDSPGGSR